MCGICGIIDYKGGAVDEAGIRAMSDKMAHRGPDDSGIYINLTAIPRVGLGHRRLAIIDLSSLGRQPMSNEDGSVRVILNGEIYNFRELRKELETKGHRFSSHTDTETVVHLYEEYGEDCVKYLRGMFAFAVWDIKQKKLVLARDRAGKKPLLYCRKNGAFAFASEFTVIFESGIASKDINKQALDIYLSLGYIPAPLTIYENVRKLPPAHILVLKDGKVSIRRYWTLDYSKKLDIGEADAADELLRLLKEAVKVRLYSDVPLGAFLSGGIDSSAVVALMSMESSARVKTFSIGFAEGSYNELKHARRIAERFGTDHHELIVKPDAIKILPLLVERYGEPYADSSCIPTYYVASETRRSVTVALNGDGGDESFAGYERYQAMLASEIYQGMPAPVRAAVKTAVMMLPDSSDPKNRLRRLKRLFEGIALPATERYLRWVVVFNRQEKDALYSPGFIRQTAGSGPEELLRPYLSGEAALLDRALAADVNIYLPNDLLVKVDITSMANSLETRSPFLDHKLMEFAASLPPEYKMKAFVKKYILKKALKGIVPGENVYRSKMGFGIPVGKWFRGEMRHFMEDTVLSEKALERGYFKPGAVMGMFAEHVMGKKDHTFRLWALLMLELWHRRFID